MWNKDEIKSKSRRKTGEAIERKGKFIAGSAVTGLLGLTLLGANAFLSIRQKEIPPVLGR